jgi:hypothetical protein
LHIEIDHCSEIIEQRFDKLHVIDTLCLSWGTAIAGIPAAPVAGRIDDKKAGASRLLA